MASQKDDILYCEICGQEVKVVEPGAIPLCCGQKMKKR